MRKPILRAIAGAACLFSLCRPAAAVETNLLNRPPISAPVTTVGVSALPIVRSQTEGVEDVVTGLIAGLTATNRAVTGASFLAVRDDHVVVRKDFGDPKSDEPFDGGTMADLLAAIALMQQIEQAKLLATENLVPGATAEAVLTHQSRTDLDTVTGAVARISGEPYPAYLARHIFAPLKMSLSGLGPAGLRLSVADTGQLMGALLNDGAAGQARILQPATVDLMQRTHLVPHPALPGYTYGFSEMRRNGWRALQHDGEGRGVQTRMVLIPEARFGYFLMLRGHGDAAFWRTFDNTLFDRAFPSHAAPDSGLRGTPAPTAAMARDAAGSYGPAEDAAGNVAPLKNGGARLTVEARADGALMLSGIENAVLSRREGGYWGTDSGNLNAVFRNGRLLLSSGDFTPLAPWFRWDIYMMLAIAAAFMTMGAFTFEHRGHRAAYVPGNLVLMGGVLTIAFGLAAGLIWLMASGL